MTVRRPRALLVGLCVLLLGTACSTQAPTPSGSAAPTSPPPSPTAPAAASTSSPPTAGSESPGTPPADGARRTDASDQQLVRATTGSVSFTDVATPATLAEDLRQGGHVIVFRYTGAGGDPSPVPAALREQVRDDGQRISEQSVARMQAYGQAYRDHGIPVNRVLSSEYYFVWQHADAAFGEPIDIHRDLTGSLDFDDPAELETSLQGLRNRTVTPPDPGTNTVLFTHQGKFDKAYGFYPDAGTTIVFRPDGSGTPRVVAVLSYEDFMNLWG